MFIYQIWVMWNFLQFEITIIDKEFNVFFGGFMTSDERKKCTPRLESYIREIGGGVFLLDHIHIFSLC